MSSAQDDDRQGEYASPPCFMHELDAEALGFAPEPDAQTRIDVVRWRRATRARLISERAQLPQAERARIASRIAAGLDALFGDVTGRTIGVYWPIRGEPDLRPWMDGVRARGGKCALPVVVRPKAPVEFRVWWPGMPLDRGVWDVPVPAEGPAVIPDEVVAPLVGFDEACYRLGHGGGYYDRTLAALAPRPRAIGIGAQSAALSTIFPLPHDIPMDVIVTEIGTFRRGGDREC
jgi:5-formyltetrahydrofolate cyclo-ligase